MDEQLQIANQQQIATPPGDPKKKLWQKLNEAGSYTKSYDEFSQQFSNPQSISKLYSALNSSGKYTKTQEDFNNQFFPDATSKKKDFSLAPTESQKQQLPYLYGSQNGGALYGSGGESNSEAPLSSTDANDPVKSILQPIRNQYAEAQKAYDPFRNRSVADATANKVLPVEVANQAANEVNNKQIAEKQSLYTLNAAHNVIKNQLGDVKVARQALDKIKQQNNGVVPKDNETAQFAEESVKDYNNLSQDILGGKSIKQAAIEEAVKYNPEFANYYKTLDGKIPKSYEGKLVTSYLARHGQNVQNFVEEHPEYKSEFNDLTKDFAKNYPETMAAQVGSEVSQAYEDQSKSAADFNTDGFNKRVDDIANQLYKGDPQKLAIYNQYVKDNKKDYFKSAAALNKFGGEVLTGLNETMNTLRSATGLRDSEERAYDVLDKQGKFVHVQPKGIRDWISEGSGFMGMVAQMGATGNVLGGLGAAAEGTKAVPAITRFYDEQLRDEEGRLGDNWKAKLGAGIKTGMYAFAPNAIPTGKIQGAIDNVLKDVSDKTAVESVRARVTNAVTEALKQYGKGIGEMTAIKLGEQITDAALGKPHEGADEELYQTAKSMAMGNVLPSLMHGIGAYAGSKVEEPIKTEENGQPTDITTPTTGQTGAEVRDTKDEQAGVNTTDNGLQDGNGGGGKDVGREKVDTKKENQLVDENGEFTPLAKKKADEWIMNATPDEIRQKASDISTRKERIFTKYLGEDGYKEYRKLQRIADSDNSSREAALKAEDRLDELESKIPKEELANAYVKPEEYYEPHEWRRIVNALDATHPDVIKDVDNENLFNSFGREITQGDIFERPEDAITARESYNELKKRGFSDKEILQNGISERVQQGHNPEHLMELAKANIEKIQAKQATTNEIPIPSKGKEDVGGEKVEDNYVSKFPKPDKPITDLSSDELYEYANRVKDYNKNIEKEFFGEEGAKKYREAYRTWNNMYADPKEQEAAGKIVKEMEASLTPSQEKEFFGIGAPDNGMYDHKEIADVARKVSLIEGAENVNDIARSLKLPLLDFSKNTDNPPIESVIVLNAAKKRAAELGIDPQELIKKSLERIAADLPDKEDAAFLAKTVLDKLIQNSTVESNQKKLTNEIPIPSKEESPTIKEPNTGKQGAGEENGKPKEEFIQPIEPTNEGQPPSQKPVKEVPGGGDEWSGIRKEKVLQDVKGAKEVYERATRQKWSETMQSSLEDLAKNNPNKSLYDAAKSHVIDFASKYDRGEVFNPSSKDLAIFHYFKAETLDKLNNLTERLKSTNDAERNMALAEADLIQNDLTQVAKAINPTEAGRAFAFRQSELRNDPEYGLQIRRMELQRANNGHPLSAEDEAFLKDNWDKEKEIIEQRHELEKKSMQDQFDKKLEQVRKEYEDKLKNAKGGRQSVREKTLGQKGKDVADQIRKLKIGKNGTTNVDFTFGTWDLAIEGIAKLVEGGATIAEAIDKLIKDKSIGFKNEDEKNKFEATFIREINNASKRENAANEIKKIADEAKTSSIMPEMVHNGLIKDFVDSHIGKVDQDKVLDEAAKNLKKILPDTSKDELLEAYLKKGDFKQPTKRDLEIGIRQQQKELKKIAKQQLTADQVQDIKLKEAKEKAIKNIQDYSEKISKGDYSKPEAPVGLNKYDAELIALKSKEGKLELAYKKKQREIEERNKGWLERTADTARNLYVAFLIGGVKTFSKISLMSVARPFSEAATKLSFGKAFDAIFPNISKAALRGGESNSWRSVEKGFGAYFRQMGAKRMQAKFENSMNDYKNALDKYNEAKANGVKGDELKKLENDMTSKLLNATGNVVYQFIGGSSINDALQALIHRNNKIEEKFGFAPRESIKNGNWLDKANYVLGFIGRSHSALKTFSGRFSFAAAFMARLEAEARDNPQRLGEPNRLMEIAHESYLDFEGGKYQQPNFITEKWNQLVRAADQKFIDNPEWNKYNKAWQALMRGDVAITRVPVNILHEQVMEYTLGAFRAVGMAAKAIKNAKAQATTEGLTKDMPEFKSRIKDIISNMDEKQAATIARCFRKGGLGLGLYAFFLIGGAMKFGVYPHMGQPKKKDDEDLAKDELNPDQIQIGNTKLGETASSAIAHIPVLWPSLMGLGMAYQYHRDIKKGKTPTASAMDAAYTHLKIIEGSIPQSKVFSPLTLASNAEGAVKKRLTEYGLIDDSKGLQLTDKEKQDPVFKKWIDLGVDLPKIDDTKVEIKDKNTHKKQLLVNYPQKTIDEYNNTHKAFLKEGLAEIGKMGHVWIDKYGDVTTKKPAYADRLNYKMKNLSDLNMEQKKEIVKSISASATRKTKVKMHFDLSDEDKKDESTNN